MRISSERGYSFTTTSEREIVRGVKEALCFITFDPAQTSKSIAESSNKKQTNVCLDGNIISVGAECFRCESVFQPSIIGKEAYRIHDTSFQNVMKCDVDIRVNLYANVVLPSSTTMSKISERMTKKPTELSPLTMRSRWLLHQRDSTRCGLEGLSCFFFSRCGS